MTKPIKRPTKTKSEVYKRRTTDYTAGLGTLICELLADGRTLTGLTGIHRPLRAVVSDPAFRPATRLHQHWVG